MEARKSPLARTHTHAPGRRGFGRTYLNPMENLLVYFRPSIFILFNGIFILNFVILIHSTHHITKNDTKPEMNVYSYIPYTLKCKFKK